MQLYVSGRNLFTFTDWVGWDPEARQVARGNSSWDSTRGETVYDSSNYPMTKSCVFEFLRNERHSLLLFSGVQ